MRKFMWHIALQCIVNQAIYNEGGLIDSSKCNATNPLITLRWQSTAKVFRGLVDPKIDRVLQRAAQIIGDVLEVSAGNVKDALTKIDIMIVPIELQGTRGEMLPGETRINH